MFLSPWTILKVEKQFLCFCCCLRNVVNATFAPMSLNPSDAPADQCFLLSWFRCKPNCGHSGRTLRPVYGLTDSRQNGPNETQQLVKSFVPVSVGLSPLCSHSVRVAGLQIFSSAARRSTPVPPPPLSACLPPRADCLFWAWTGMSL